MKDPSGYIRTWLYGVLNTTVSYGGSVVPVYSVAPKDAAFPYMLIGSQTADPEGGTKDKWITNHSVQLEIYSSHTGNDASYVPVNTIANSAIQLIRTRAKVTIDSTFNVISCTVVGLVTDHIVTDTNTIMYKSILINLEIEEK
jgi:hypothetical protein